MVQIPDRTVQGEEEMDEPQQLCDRKLLPAVEGASEVK